MNEAQALAIKPTGNEFLDDVLEGLRAAPKSLPPKYFYDSVGSQYFDEICNLTDYYPYHTELELLPQVGHEIAQRFHARGLQNLEIVEFGAGSLRKVGILLRALRTVRHFTAIDISQEHLIEACRTLESQYRELTIHPCVHDFTKPLKLSPSDRTRVGFFPGSTIGNLDRDQARTFLRNAGKTLGSASYMIIGVDTQKPEPILHRAYNDGKGVTARFNKNMLVRINRELGGDFTLENFAHHAFYNSELGRIEMHLRSLKEQAVNIDGERFHFGRGESIHTENSYKYRPVDFTQLAKEAGWSTERLWLAPEDLFSISLLKYCGE
ncbi:L-histidine N(alpha)-methyltransferase [Gilvimarinus xylanilyticus]|uniref:L-histidine N(Alpha)-methyltransferase n=1 Tax=Gilvimarinus xylanilyticus TaxID=2944139 RepID=A0A9X2I250_9GAMM|nr:L-histidine N(alpha)-methyltransferase [Gilvimarinus xylanilyticus]MCP8898746.1 L-histidine N(alpha)-methyltransferase [Gilvimarinus xylanilyticus]